MATIAAVTQFTYILRALSSLFPSSSNSPSAPSESGLRSIIFSGAKECICFGGSHPDRYFTARGITRRLEIEFLTWFFCCSASGNPNSRLPILKPVLHFELL
ncbi:hypothetical protein WG66_004622 [Moniliophthora roreri]|nr:hypothetical protein WG66_004622 [Moniliophthora roreri]